MAEPKTVKEWLCENIDLYTDRRKFFADAVQETDSSYRTVQKAYKELFNPVLNTKSPSVIEDNRGLSKQDMESAAELNMLKDENEQLKIKVQEFDDLKDNLNKLDKKFKRQQVMLKNYRQEILDAVSSYSFTDVRKPYKDVDEEITGIVQLSDLHLNEEIDIPGNRFDFDIASKRMRMFAEKAKKIFEVSGVKKTALFLTGDLINSDRRPDEYLNNTLNRASGLILAVDVIRQFIEDLSQDFDICIAGVAGNESRIPDDWGWTEKVASDNFDCIIFEVLKMMHRDSNVLTYFSGLAVEQLFNIGNKNILITHGFKAGAKPDKFAEDVRARFAARGKTVDFVISGHKHTPIIGDFFGISGSLSGPNSYGEAGLNSSCRASQNLYIVHQNGGVDGIKVDLQNPVSEGYSIDFTSLKKHIKDRSKPNSFIKLIE